MTLECLEQGSTQKRNRGEALETFLKRVTHISIVGKGIGSMENLHLCKHLTGEHLSGNRIGHIAGLQALPSLETLHIDNQKIEEPLTFDVYTMKALAPSLKVMTATGNKIHDVSPLAFLSELTDLDISHNSIAGWTELEYMLAGCVNLTTLNVDVNPITRSIIKFRQKVILASPSLVCLNEKDIPQVERDFLCNMQTARRKSQVHRASQNHHGSKDSLLKLSGSSSTLFSEHSSGLYPTATSSLAGMELHSDEPKPIPHLPPYASQYRDLMIHQVTAAHKSVESKAKRVPGAYRGVKRAPRAAKAAEIHPFHGLDSNSAGTANRFPLDVHGGRGLEGTWESSSSLNGEGSGMKSLPFEETEWGHRGGYEPRGRPFINGLDGHAFRFDS
ncbi:hypothetical protein HDV05_002887 [Chytridiales sp. JEL 0842]|nr:hypothetical protein HDV05_002887 [Chytridiales sp. JEL 0842]